MRRWQCALTLDAQRRVIAGSEKALADAIRHGADLRVNTEFVHNEHLDVDSDNDEPVCEVAQFGVTYLVEDRWVAGIMNLRQPVNPPVAFGARPSMSFFLYNQNGHQAVARPFLDGRPACGIHAPMAYEAPPNMPKYHALDSWNHDSRAPSSNFIYDFNVYRYFVSDDWTERLAHDKDGNVQAGSVDLLVQAFKDGCAIKVAVGGLCDNLAVSDGNAPEHQVFIEAGSCYYATARRIFSAGSRPLVRVQPAVPMRYRSGNWDFGWLFITTGGTITYRRCDPFTLTFSDLQRHCPVRWFAR